MDISVVIVSYKSEHLIIKNIEKFNKNTRIFVIENAEDKTLKEQIENKFRNVKVILNKNRGFSQAANLGAELAKTKYIFFCSPDNIISNNCFQKLEKIADDLNDKFSLLVLSNQKDYTDRLKKVEEVEGISCFLIKKDSFSNISGFDENFFLYYEDIDLVKRLLNNNNNIYKIPVKYHSEGASHNKRYNYPLELNRNWHYMWSKFYYIKKHKGYFFSLILTLPFFLRSIFKMIYNFNNPEKRNIYYARFSGLLNSYRLKKSWYRPNLKIK